MKNYADLNDYELLYMIGENDDIANNMMYQKYMPIIKKEASRLYKYAHKLGLEKSDVEQEGYTALFSSLKNFNYDKNVLFYTYVVTAIKRKMMNLIRINLSNKNKSLNNSISLDKSITEDDATLLSFLADDKIISPESAFIEKSIINDVKSLLYSMPIDDASILELKINGFKVKEMAILLGMKNHSILHLLNRIKKNLNFIIEK